MGQVDEPCIWTELGHAQLASGAVADAIASYLRSGDTSRAPDVIARAQEAGANAELVEYLLMVRKKQEVFEMSLVTHPQVADAIVANDVLPDCERRRVAQSCEKAGLYMRALQYYCDRPDIKRVIVNTHATDHERLVHYIGSMSPEFAFDCLQVWDTKR